MPLLVCYNLFKGIYDTNCKAHTLRDTWAGIGFLDWLGDHCWPNHSTVSTVGISRHLSNSGNLDAIVEYV